MFKSLLVLKWILSFYRPQTKFAKVMFSQVSVCPQGGVCPIACWDTPLWQVHLLGRYTPLGRHPLGRYTPGQTPPGRYTHLGTPPDRYTPWAGTPLGMHTPRQVPSWTDTPLGRHPPGQVHPCLVRHPYQCMLGYKHPLCTVHVGIWSTSRQYTSHWNAFLFVIKILMALREVICS